MRYFERDARGLEGDLEAVARRPRRDDRHRRFTVTPVHREQEVGLFGLRGQAGGRPTALHVDEQQRELEAHREAEALALEVDAGATRGGDAELARERGADRDADRGDLVFGLQRAHAEVLVARQLVEDVGRRRDRVRRVEDRQVRVLRRGEQPVRDRRVAADVAVLPGRERGRRDLVRGAGELGGLAEVQAGLERGDVGVDDDLARAVLLARSTRAWDRSGGCTSTR